MGRTHELWRKLTGADEQLTVPPRYSADEHSHRDLYIIVGFGILMVVFGVVVAFIGLF
jgi:hypothetical protein